MLYQNMTTKNYFTVDIVGRNVSFLNGNYLNCKDKFPMVIVDSNAFRP